MLLSTMIPGIINTIFASFLFFRSFKQAKLFIVENAVIGQPIPVIPRLLVALILSVQHWAASCVATCFLLVGAIWIGKFVYESSGHYVFESVLYFALY